MTTEPLHISPETLHEHHEWMRALARKLVATPGGEEDVVQDAWVQALERPPGSGWPLKAWLSGVLRNVARQRGREQARRTRREQLVAREAETTAEAGSGGGLERLANHQDVVNAVLELREPYRTAIVMRYYEGFAPRKIALRQGVTVATVKSRLTRGLAMLRERFAHEYGAGRAWALALAPLVERPEGWASSLMGAVAAKSVWVASASVAVITATSIWWVARGAEPELRPGMETVEPALASVPVKAANPDGERDVLVREPVAGNVPAGSSVERDQGQVGEGVVRAGDLDPPAGTHAVELEFVRGDKKALTPGFARIELRGAEGVYDLEVANQKMARLEGVPAGVYELTIETGGEYRHVPQELDFRDTENNDNEGKAAFSHHVTLWPDDWIPIIVRTPAGENFTELAGALGYHPKNFFVDAFCAIASPEPIDPESVDVESLNRGSGQFENAFAKFREPPGYQVVEIAGSIGGSLQLFQAPPLWVGLWVHGIFFESRLLRAGDTQLYFEIDLEDLAARFASVELRLVDKNTGAPVRDAKATLKANTSSHRRHDLQDVVPEEDGTLRLLRVIPGQHELAVSREGHLVQRSFALEPGEHLDLGEVAIGSGPGIRVVVLGDNGEPARAWVELAPYARGVSTRKLYHPNLHRSTDHEGAYHLPVPDRDSIVRARHMRLQTAQGFYGNPGVSTANVFIDADDPPREIRLLQLSEHEVNFEPMTPWTIGDRLLFLDALGLIVDGFEPESVDGLKTRLLEGPYRVQRWSAEGLLLGEVEVRVDETHTSVIVP